MSYLFPRLLAGQAEPLHESYQRLSLEELTRRVATRHPSAVYVATGGDRVPESALKELRSLVLALAAEADSQANPTVNAGRSSTGAWRPSFMPPWVWPRRRRQRATYGHS